MVGQDDWLRDGFISCFTPPPSSSSTVSHEHFDTCQSCYLARQSCKQENRHSCHEFSYHGSDSEQMPGNWLELGSQLTAIAKAIVV